MYMVNCVYIYKWVPVEIQMPIHWNQISQSMATPPAVLPPSSIFPPPLSHCAFIPTRNNLVYISKMSLILLFSCYFEIVQVWKCLTCNCVRRGFSTYSLLLHKSSGIMWFLSVSKFEGLTTLHRLINSSQHT